MSEVKVPQKSIANAIVVYSRLLKYVRLYWGALLIAIVASIVYSGVDAWFVHFLEPLLNKGLVAKNKHFLRVAPLLVLIAFLTRGIASFFSNYNIAAVSRQVIMKLRQEVFRHFHQLPASAYDQASGGENLAIILYSVEQVANASADVLTTAIQASCLIAGLLIVMFKTSWKLSLLYFVIIPSIGVIMRYTSLRVRRLSLTIQDSVAAMTHCAEETLIGYKEVRAFGGQAHEIARFDQLTNANRQGEMKVVAARSWSVSSVQLVAALALAMTFYIATFDIADSILSPGGFIAMVAAMLALIKPMKDLASMQNKLYRGLSGAQTVFDFLDQPAEEDVGQIPLIRATGNIDYQHINFAYHAGHPVLNDICLTIKAGETVALVGRSGSGKTTLINLLPRFYDYASGDILIDGQSIKAYKLFDLRNQFALVSQQVTLFDDTIANNIAFGQTTSASRAAIKAAADAAYLSEFIEQLPQGFDTPIGNNGLLLSGGQRQRLAIARAILKDAPILILDEATSALDTESERYIQQALANLMKGRTTVVIAHRLSTIEHADKIVVLDKGQIVEIGTHQDLLRSPGFYAKLQELQVSEEALETS